MNEEKIEKLQKENGWDWYAVTYNDDPENPRLMHQTGLSNILQCGQDPANFGILDMRQCGLE